MSEYQYVAFRAVEGPVSEKNLEFMRRQSSRAEITPRSFDNEYHFGDFGGNALEMLRRGYDLHVHYANFGVRTLMIRLRQGWPDAAAARPYCGKEGLEWKKDKTGPGGILSVRPGYEPDQLEELWELDEIADRLAPLVGEIAGGDLRPLYLAHLAVHFDGNHDWEEEVEGPVPAGLDRLTPAQQALAEFYGIDKWTLAAAAKDCPALPQGRDATGERLAWLGSQPAKRKDQWLAQWMGDEHAGARRELLAAFHESTGGGNWPTVQLGRTLADLQSIAEELREQSQRKAAAKAEKARGKRLAAMAANPTPTLRATEKLVAQRSTKAYREAAAALAELREALAGSPRSNLADDHARKLVELHPTLRRLISELRQQGFVPK